MVKELRLNDLNCRRCIFDLKKYMSSKNIKIKTNSKDISFFINQDDNYELVVGEINDVLKKHGHNLELEEVASKAFKKSLIIDNLTCTSCAAKIEARVGEIEGINSADLDFVNSKININISSLSEYERIVKEAKKIVKEVEPDASIVDEVTLGDKGVIKRTVYSLLLASIPFVLGIVFRANYYYSLSFFLISYLIVGKSVIFKAFKNIKRGELFDENTLMLIATVGAFFIGEFYEAIAVMVFYLVGEMFQDLAVDRSRRSIANLMDIKSEYANLKDGDNITKVSPETVVVGSLIVVKAGERVPLDGVVVEGFASLDTSSLTGEAIPKDVSPGDEVISGFINLDNLLVIKTTKEYNDSTVNKILELVEEASSKKAPTENFISRFAKYYTPIVVLIAAMIAFLVPTLLQESFEPWIYRALSFLVVSCPCALVISVPLGFYGGIGFASKNGVLIKGGNFLESLKNSEEIVFDKTGTLTTSEFVITKINPVKLDERALLKIVAHAEYYSNHPIAKAIVRSYEKEIDSSIIKDYQELSGHGVLANIDNMSVIVGNDKLLLNNKIEVNRINAVGTVLYIGIDGVFAGSIVINDKIKAEAASAIKKLRDQGFKKISMVTGDRFEIANSVKEELGLDEVYAEVLPDEKVNIISAKIKENNKKIVFVGDGINDAPVLAISDVGISMGQIGSDAAIEASDIVIMNDSLEEIAKAKYIAKKTTKTVWENIIFALSVKIIALILMGFGIINMWVGVFADVGVSLIAILNAMKILKMKVKK